MNSVDDPTRRSPERLDYSTVSEQPTRYSQSRSADVLNGGLSHWWQELGIPKQLGSLDHDLHADVCIVGAGLTGLWAAHYLAEADPGLNIVILEAEFAGFGASGRNGGWLSAELAGSRATYARGPGGEAAVDSLEELLTDSVDVVIDFCRDHAVDADVVKSGVLHAATSAAQLARIEGVLSAGSAAQRQRLQRLTASETQGRIAVAGAMGGLFDPQCARVQPAKLVRGLVDVVRKQGVVIYEQTRVLRVESGKAHADHGVVRAPVILRCTEGYTARLPGERRTWLPMNSAMIVTEPLGPQTWSALKWEGRELLGDAANAYFYAQRTADDRVALGGRGVPYRFGSRTDVDGQTQARTITSLRETLARTFPILADAPLSRAWCGVLAVPRDWCASVSLDPRTGLGHAGGYIGSGLTATNLAGRTLRDLVLREKSPLVELPWTNRSVRSWEPEPLRWLGVKSMYALYRAADNRESHGLVQPSRLAKIADRVARR